MKFLRRLSQKWKIRAVLAALVLTFALTKPDIEGYGTAYQIALPVIALGCALTNGEALDYGLRYVSQWAVVQGSKNLSGKANYNQRPRGGFRGMPSGHTATAVFGASYLVSRCITANPLVKGVVLLSAGFVGGSRIAVGAHDIWQVMLGALVGWGGDRLFRRGKTPLARLREVAARRGKRRYGPKRKKLSWW